jgi:hypothetical protein
MGARCPYRTSQRLLRPSRVRAKQAEGRTRRSRERPPSLYSPAAFANSGTWSATDRRKSGGSVRLEHERSVRPVPTGRRFEMRQTTSTSGAIERWSRTGRLGRKRQLCVTLADCRE